MPCKWYSCCPVKRHVDNGHLEKHWVEDYCLSEVGFANCVRYKKEEAGEAHPDSMRPDGKIDPRLKSR